MSMGESECGDAKVKFLMHLQLADEALMQTRLALT
jgi:hypothetical protein